VGLPFTKTLDVPGEVIRMGYALLVGNGINRVSASGPSWRNIIDEIAKEVNQSQVLKRLDVKPFTLAFEELILLAERQGKRRIEVERLVAEQIQKLEASEYHKRVMTLGTQHVLTTNYDYALELAIDRAHSEGGYKVLPKYNVFRHRTAGDIKVWHIHGEAAYPRSLILGYDNYTGTVQKMRQYIKSSAGYHGLRSPFRRGTYNFDKDGTNYSWIDVFLRDDIHIVGFGLEYIEIDLWWLIYYKADLEKRKKNVGKTLYYRFTKEKSSLDELGKLDLLKALGVEVHEINVKDGYKPAWDRLLTVIEKRVR
jgi:hypothetical protein